MAKNGRVWLREKEVNIAYGRGKGGENGRGSKKSQWMEKNSTGGEKTVGRPWDNVYNS